MQILQQIPATVKPLSDYFAQAEPEQRCRWCEHWCGDADACMPARGPIHQPYYTVRQRGQHFFAVCIDPQADQVYILNRKARRSPCEAAWDAVRWSTDGRNRFPVRLDQARVEAKVNWNSIQQRIVGQMYRRGVDLYIEREGIEQPKGNSVGLNTLLWHPIMRQGWDDMAAANGAAFAEADSFFRIGTLDTLEVA